MKKLITLFLVISFIPLFSQDKPLRVYMYLNFFQTDNEQYLEAELKYRKEKNFVQLEGVNVDFFLETDSSDLNLGSGVTTNDGKARLDLMDLNIPKDSSGFAHYLSQFDGNDSYRKAKKTLSVKEIDLSLQAEIIDSLPTLTINGHELSEMDKSPIEDTELEILVKRLYSDLPLKIGSMEDGLYSYEFPKDLPGDAFGDLWVIARISEHDDYGTVETRKKIRWGVPVSYTLEDHPRALWSRAPLWIIIGVWTGILVAWFHYFLAVTKLFRMKKL